MFRYLENMVDPFVPGQPERPAATVRAFLLQNLRPFRGIIALSVLASIASVVIELALLVYVGNLVDSLMNTPRETLWADRGTEFVLIAVGLLVLRPLVALVKEGLDDIAFRPNAVSLFRWRAHRYLLRQPVIWFRHQASGLLGSRVREVGVSAAGAVYCVLHIIVDVAIYFVGSILLLTSVDLRLALPVVLWAVLYVGHMAYTVPRFRDNYERFNEALANLTRLFVDSYANIETIKLFADPDSEDRESEKAFRAARRAFLDLQKFEVITNVGMLALGTVLLVGLIGYSVVLWQAGEVPLGFIAAALALSLRVNGMAERLLDAIATLFGWVGATRDSLKSISQPLALREPEAATPFEFKGGAIRLDDVVHRYGRDHGGLDRLSLEVRAGEKLGIVGPSGAGKSTLLGALMRHFDIEDGRITIDGADIGEIRQRDLLSRISLVAQEPALLDRTVAANIAFGRENASGAEIEAAARQARAHVFILQLRDAQGRTGYDAQVGERGVQLSGGQRQRIALARALLKNAPILLLDEATSALDSESEAAILDTLYPMMEGRTVIAIAHRLSTLSRMDRIAVLDAGRVVEIGTHGDLLAQNGLYSRLWRHQTDGFLGYGPVIGG
ncbi:ABC transporter ATP-binding protein [Nitratireductor sp. ZSWI3]|uniref:ABC transporter ATP-binding protein n=1 Tax=Nitratireductor sp. ZSWI3 TaxID=2966359 RepID=UPI00214F8E09|nr:ABC transporter ATP-binding protein [Nitratireductor sp. ZSWI3]MCR4267711.1 ABC transporter ATP-binding protein/permease [Nitratireductor sp. ZSWI3]